jgi:hypothetical protein
MRWTNKPAEVRMVQPNLGSVYLPPCVVTGRCPVPAAERATMTAAATRAIAAAAAIADHISYLLGAEKLPELAPAPKQVHLHCRGRRPRLFRDVPHRQVGLVVQHHGGALRRAKLAQRGKQVPSPDDEVAARSGDGGGGVSVRSRLSSAAAIRSAVR